MCVVVSVTERQRGIEGKICSTVAAANLINPNPKHQLSSLDIRPILMIIHSFIIPLFLYLLFPCTMNHFYHPIAT